MNARCAVVGRVVRRNVVRRSAVAALGIVTALGGTGCGGPVKLPISGSVTLEGKPLDEAVIMFVPLTIQAGKTGAAVEAGRYAVPRNVGLRPGRYRVEIADNPPLDSAHGPGQSLNPARRTLPVAYSSVSSPLAIDVTANGPTEFDFALTSNLSQAP